MAYNRIVPTETECAYAAGIIDGEGTISAYRQKSPLGHFRYYIRVHFHMLNADVPLWFELKFGGKAWPVSRKTSTAKYQWSINCRKAAEFLGFVLPYLKLKKSRAELAIELANAARMAGTAFISAPGTQGIRSAPLSADEQKKREELAFLIRAENCASNKGARATSKWGVN